MAAPPVSLKLLINKLEPRVLLAEGKKDFFEFLFSPPNPVYKCAQCTLAFISPVPRSCPYCSRKMCLVETVVSPESDSINGYMVMDDLLVAVVPMSLAPIFDVFEKLKINVSGIHVLKGKGALEEKVVHLSMDEGMELLQLSSRTATALTDFFLGQRTINDENPQ